MYLLGVEAFLAVIRTQSITRAAKELHIAQSSVSHRLKVLEQEVGAKLIERNQGVQGISLTPMGEEFTHLAERWFTLSRETQILQSRGPHLTLSLGTVDSLNTFFFPELYCAISQHQPALRLTVRTQHSKELYQEVENRQVDVAFVLREICMPNILVEEYFSEPMVILSLKTSSDSQSEVVQSTELDPHYELFVPWGGPHFQSWHDKLWNPLCPAQINLDSANLIFHVLRDPRQWVIVPLWVAKAALKRNCYSIRTLSPTPPNLVCYRITHKYPKASTLQSIAILDHYLKNYRSSH
ncbi:MAG: LysR family transcriptional regulator [Negativicutes bacterium]|nr:LysR family transcriptional regulator [Negativicutes bacterium]